MYRTIPSNPTTHIRNFTDFSNLTAIKKLIQQETEMNETFQSVNNKRADQNHAIGKTGSSWLSYQGSPFSIKSNINIIKPLTCGETKNKQPKKGKSGNSFTLVSGSEFVDLSVPRENCELSFPGDKVRTAPQKTAPQRAPRDCSKEEEGKVIHMCSW